MKQVICDMCGKSGIVCGDCGSVRADNYMDKFLNEGPDVGGFEITICAGCQLRLRRKYITYE